MESSEHEELKGFIKKKIGYKVTESTVFFKDLDLIGDDADTFMLELSQYFEIDMTDFKFDEYFINEYNIPFLYFYDIIFRKEKIKRKEFDLNHLEAIVKNRKWIDI